jgi:hypothetical protein
MAGNLEIDSLQQTEILELMMVGELILMLTLGDDFLGR